jgi:tryptophan-rich sensory protein
MKRSRSSDIAGLFGSVLLVAGAAVLGSIFSYDGASDWYRDLAKPGWTPPSWVFGPAWTTLYILIAVSGWLVWLRRDRTALWPAFAVFLVQLALNALWSLLFFGMRRPGLALVDVVLLLAVILLNVAVFWRLSRLAGLLLVPYLGWTGFATLLNYAIWRLNTK